MAVILAGGQGCTPSKTENFYGKDRGVVFPSFRTTWSLKDTENESPDERPNPDLRWEVDLVYGKGESLQGLDSSEFMRFNGTTFSGPIDIQAHYELYAISTSFLPQFTLQKYPVRLSPLLGIGAQQFRIKLSVPGQEVTDRTRSLGPIIGGQLGIFLKDWLEVYGRLSGTVGIFGDHFTRLGRFEAGLALTPLKNLSLVAGFNRINYAEDRSSADADARFSGPLFGIHLNF